MVTRIFYAADRTKNALCFFNYAKIPPGRFGVVTRICSGGILSFHKY
ncbi:hypothetical protein ROSEINA2194_02792 [Roseburia inulinivorans DSM 16841]|uniref:Uncharacterized protein n=1 Tax=Roseburia inulinivorans DSM 16841 TaxID=622312 RepID=C0FVL7_9FIRM|nr:hypothetical protein ROSEINA2194_02792 [Roseburia inulinivorans DSM 16841]